MNIYASNVERVLAERPELADIINVDALKQGIVDHYSTGVKGIANAYIRKSDASFMIINRKNALFAMMLVLATEIQENEPYFENKNHDFDAMTWLLMPKDITASTIDNTFYKRLFNRMGFKDDMRNALNCKAFKDLFAYNLVSRYEMINEQLGGKYTEADIQALGTSIYEEVKTEEMERAGEHAKMTERTRAIISEKVSDILRNVHGWGFTHREYDELVVDEELMFAVREAYPAEAAIIEEMRETAHFEMGENMSLSRGATKMESEMTNPITKSQYYIDAAERSVTIMHEVIEYDEEELARAIRSNTDKTEDQVEYEYLEKMCRMFVTDTEHLRGLETSESKIAEIGSQIAAYIFKRTLICNTLKQRQKE